MKTLFTILLLIFGLSLFSQDWAIIDTNKTYFYSHSDSLHLTNTIHIESNIITENLDSFRISNKYLVCDTCNFDPQNEIIIHRYAKEFLGFFIVFNNENNTYEIDGNIIFHESNLGDIWDFNSSTTAEIISIDEQEIIGEIDVIKTIELSSADTIILSQNHGIIRYPDFENEGKYYELKGYYDNEGYYGEVFPNFWSIYDFEVGDEYCYATNSGYMSFNYYTRQFRINEKYVNENIIDYESFVNEIHSSNGIIWENGNSDTSPLSTEYSNYNTILDFEWNSNSMEDKQGIHENNNDYSVISNSYSEGYGYFKTIRSFTPYEEGLLYSYIGDCEYYFNEQTSFFYDYGSCAPEYPFVGYANHLGLILNFHSDSFDYYNKYIRGAVINGDTIGDFCDFPINLNIQNNIPNKDFNIYPNPANSQIKIQGKYKSLQIFSQLGLQVMKLESPTTIIDVSHLTKGIYLVQAINDEKIYTTKLVIE